ncbi:hypothetical protein RhiirA4_485733 [Rhizophagus irregularis]|uniref:Uncharacterized protein n=1 Tax=Rhizophagus irregularis TaxID=588596 RepID=A0A2I1HQK4_9GLOM|nr:hypothetical protein RhiirA4_485733 [Rhizophagus irregularis]
MDSYYNDNVYVYENDAENHMSSSNNNMENDFYEDEPEDSPFKEIYKNIDEICKKYLIPNSLTLQCKQMVESLLYKTWIKEVENIYLLDSNQYNKGFVENNLCWIRL